MNGIEINREVLLLASLVIGILGFVLYLFSVHRKNPNLRLYDIVTGDNGRYASAKVIQFGGFLSATWGFFWIMITGKGQVELVVGWVAVCSGFAALSKALENKKEPVPTPATVTITGATPNENQSAVKVEVG